MEPVLADAEVLCLILGCVGAEPNPEPKADLAHCHQTDAPGFQPEKNRERHIIKEV